MPRRGPTTERGRSIARLNALKHGFAARSPVIPGIEDQDDWERHHKGVIESLQPEGYFEELLVRRLATTLWEVDRLTAYQVAATMRHIASTADRMGIAANYMSGTKEIVQPDPDEVHERQHGRLLPEGDDLEKIMRYGAVLHRQWVQTLNQLRAAQAGRRGEHVPMALVDFSAPPTLGPHRSVSPKIPDFLAGNK